MPRKNILGALFDIKPIDRSGNVPLAILRSIKSRVNLRPTQESNIKPAVIEYAVPSYDPPIPSEASTVSYVNSELSERELLLREFEDAIAEQMSPSVVLSGFSNGQTAYTAEEVITHLPESTLDTEAVASFWQDQPIVHHKIDQLLPKKTEHVRAPDLRAFVAAHRYSSAGNDIERILRQSQLRPSIEQAGFGEQQKRHAQLAGQHTENAWENIARPHAAQAPARRRNFIRHWAFSLFLFIGLFAFVAWLSYSRSVSVKNNVLRNGGNAVANLEKAHKDLEESKFGDAADGFALAYDDLNKASGTLGKIGASFLSVLGNLPFFNKVSAANNLVDAGQDISKAGENLSRAFHNLSNAEIGAYFDYEHPNQQKSLAKLIGEFREVLAYARDNINHAKNILADIDIAAIPQDKQLVFKTFESKVPTIQKYSVDAVDYADFLLRLIGQDTKKYLVLFQNNTELRATGGFPGSYALLTFENGNIKNIKVDDIYNPDGQIKEKIIPPKPMQHITPTWGMRDANWFADFPTSAQKIEDMYQLTGGSKVDGVITMTPDVILDVLRLVGPIEMPEYKLTLTADNFLAQIQEEIEYGTNRTQPKTILKDLQPKLFAIIRSKDKETLQKIFQIISDRLAQKHILAYFNDDELETFASERGFGGELGSPKTDFLSVVYTNIKGSKADAVTDNKLTLNTQLNGTTAKHQLSINRLDRGSESGLGFYNRPNSAYIRVYVPKGAVLDSIEGVSIPNYQPLVSYDDAYRADKDLQRIESKIEHPKLGVDVFQETNHTVFGFWLIVDPKESRTVDLSYSVPNVPADQAYALKWQKQSGTKGDRVRATFDVGDALKLDGDFSLKKIGNALVWDGDLSVDRAFEFISQ